MTAPAEFERASSLIVNVLWRASWQAAVLALLVIAIQFALRNRLSARWRHNLWFLVLLRLLLPVTPPASFSLFNFTPQMPQPAADTIPLITAHTFIAADDAPATPLQKPVTNIHFSWRLIATALWLLGALLFFSRTLFATLRLTRIVRRMTPVTDPDILALFARCAAQLNIRRVPQILHSPDFPAPALMGAIRPRLLLPSRVISDFAPHELRLIALHELAHLKRRDVAINWLLALLQCVHWFNPMIWLAFMRLRTDRELAADEMVLSMTAAPERGEYGQTIVKLLQTLTRRQSMLPGAIGILERAHPLRRRITMIAQFNGHAKRWTLLYAACMLSLAALALTDAVRGDYASPASASEKPAATQPATTQPNARIAHRTAATQPAVPAAESEHGISRSEFAIRAQFQRRLPELKFDGVPFGDVVDFLRDISGANIDVGWRGLEAAGFDRNAPVSMRVRDVTFERALRQICRQMSGGGQTPLGFTVDGDMIVISTIDDLTRCARARAYDVRDLLDSAGSRTGATTRPAREELVALVMQNVAPDSWRENGGTLGSIKEYDGRLVVTTIDMYHFDIERLLDEIRNK